MEKPLISVILPTYNRAAYLIRAMQSVLSQDYENLELLIIDDGSLDGTRDVVEAEKDSRVRYMRTPVNRGAAAARNAGIRRAKGEYLAFQDSDDKWLPGKLTKQIELLCSCSEDTALVYHTISRISENGEKRLIPDEQVAQKERSGQIFNSLLRRNYIGVPSICVRKAALTGPAGVGVFDPQMPIMEDYELILRIAAKYRIVYLEEVLADTYHLPGSSLNSDLLKGIKANCILMGKYREEMKAAGLYKQKLTALRLLGEMGNCSGQVEALIEQYC